MGTITVVVQTTGQSPDLDPDGYQVAGLPGGSQALSSNDTVEVELPAGEYSLALSGLAANCSVSVAELTLELAAGGHAEGRWDVACGLIPGTVNVAFNAPGSLGVGAAMVSLDGQSPIRIGANQSLEYGAVPPGSHTLNLSGTTPNCQITGPLTVTFTVIRNQLSSVIFAGSCSPGTIVFDEYDTGWRMFRMMADSSGRQGLAGPGVTGGRHPRLSPDGSRIVYVTSYDSLMVMQADGSQSTLVILIANVTGSSWSPSGQEIAFGAAPGNLGEVYIVNLDGTNLHNLTNHTASDGQPTWSPDGTQIAFVSNRSGSYQIYSIQPDGTGLAPLTAPAEGDSFNPVWSPDGTRIAYVNNYYQVTIMNADGSNKQPLSGHPAPVSAIAWSPDGKYIAYGVDYRGIVYALADGSATTTVNRGPSAGFYSVSWAP